MLQRRWLRITGSLVGVVVLALVVSIQAAAQDHQDPKAVAVANAMQDAMGGLANWQKAHFVRFDYIVKNGRRTSVQRSHLWDKWNGRYRLEEKMKDGKTEVVLFNSATKEGSAYIDGNKLTGDQAANALKQAYADYINDTWWLAMPFKWLYPGTNLKYIGVRRRGHDKYDVVELSFNSGAGLTPGDKYTAWVDQNSHLMTHYSYVLQNHKRGGWNWEYTETNGIKLASNHIAADPEQISMGDVRILDSVDDAFFTDPSHMLSQLGQ